MSPAAAEAPSKKRKICKHCKCNQKRCAYWFNLRKQRIQQEAKQPACQMKTHPVLKTLDTLELLGLPSSVMLMYQRQTQDLRRQRSPSSVGRCDETSPKQIAALKIGNF